VTGSGLAAAVSASGMGEILRVWGEPATSIRPVPLADDPIPRPMIDNGSLASTSLDFAGAPAEACRFVTGLAPQNGLISASR